MSNNTPSGSSGDSPERPIPPPRLPKYEWPVKGQDLPRLAWPAYVKLLADELDRELGGETGHYLGNWLTALALQAELLAATSPSEQDRLATEEADRMSAWLEALQHEATQPNVFLAVLQPDPADSDATGGWGGHEAQPDFTEQGDLLDLESDAGPIRGWLSRDSDDETFCN